MRAASSRWLSKALRPANFRSPPSVFVLSTLGENFGQVIAEALWVGRPVFVTATTPWIDLFLSGEDKNNYLR